MNNDYSQLEIDNMIEELLTTHVSKLKKLERMFLEGIQGKELNQAGRGVLIKLYDAVGEANYS